MKTTQSAHLLQSTALLDFEHATIQDLIEKRAWRKLDPVERVQSIYNFVRDEVPFGYNEKDALPASRVLSDGIGQCNTKSTLLMALLRAVGIPCRIHGFTIHKALQKGAISGIWYRLAPQNILHTWAEVQVKGQWFYLEGVILDRPYLNALQTQNPDCEGEFCGFGAATDSLHAPQIDWKLNHTFIQKNGINQDFGLFDSPDEFYATQTQLSKIKQFIFKHFARKAINRNVKRFRRKSFQ